MSKKDKYGFVLVRLPAATHKKLRIYVAEKGMSTQKMFYEYIVKLLEDKKD